MPKEKPHLNAIIIGHIDHGKSTTMGHILVQAGAVSDKELREMEKLASELDRPSWKFAYFMDRLMEERKRGITIDLAFKKFETDNYYFTIIDAPGHADFVKNMITGASQADCALLVVSAKTGEFESGIAANGQTTEHAFLAKTLGVNQIVVGVNKMDDPVVNYSEDRYNEVVAELKKLLKRVGYKPDNIAFVPMSGLMGDNLKEKSENTPWYDGDTVLQAFDKFEVPEKQVNKDLRIPVQDVYKIKGAGTVPVGRVETGKLKVGDKVVFMPSGITAEVRSIEMHHEAMKEAEAGDNIGFNIRGVDSKNINRGDVVGHVGKEPNVVTPDKLLQTQVIVIWHPTALSINYTPVTHLHTAQVAMRFAKLPKGMDYMKRNDKGIVMLQPMRKVCVEKFEDFAPLGRLAVRDMGRTVAVGLVRDIVDS
ncbi:translation elongation factor EF-1 subunit alpha [Candidatus Bathyarchaeota archaeon]|nr:translation elongation factor EF-1 subunit alpha [Candidatus Bathyarchaeota archaeon]